MLYILASLAIATVFGVGVHTTYGIEALREPWVGITFWWIIGSGAGLAVTAELRCIVCRRFRRRLENLCWDDPCLQT